MTREEYRQINTFLKKQSIALMEKENKSSAMTSFPLQNFTCFSRTSDLKYYSISTNTFLRIINDNILIKAVKEVPDKFGTKNASDVIEAILESNRDVLPQIFNAYDNDIEGYSRFLKEAHSYIIEKNSDGLNKNVLRIDLFREKKISKSDSSKDEFIGGLFHAFKHFSIGEINLSTGNDKAELYHPIRIIDYAIKAFFKGKRINKAQSFNSEVHFDSKYNLLFCFYFESVTNTYFIKTIRKNKKEV